MWARVRQNLSNPAIKTPKRGGSAVPAYERLKLVTNSFLLNEKQIANLTLLTKYWSTRLLNMLLPMVTQSNSIASDDYYMGFLWAIQTPLNESFYYDEQGELTTEKTSTVLVFTDGMKLKDISRNEYNEPEKVLNGMTSSFVTIDSNRA